MSYRSLALAKAEEKLDGDKSLNERYGSLRADLGIPKGDFRTDDEEFDLVKDVVDLRLRRIMERIQADAVHSFSIALEAMSRGAVGGFLLAASRPPPLHDIEIMARKTMYNNELKHIAPQRAYDQVPVCGRCFFTYNLLDRRREVLFAARESDTAPSANSRPVGTGISAARQWRSSRSHSAGVGSQHGIDYLTSTEKLAADARKRLLLKQEKELIEYAKRVAKAKAKTQAMYVHQPAVPQRRSAAHNASSGRGGEAFYVEQAARRQQQLREDVDRQPQEKLLALTVPPRFESVGNVNSALVVTSGEIGFNGVNFVFKPPRLPKQLALSDVRRAGYTQYDSYASNAGGAVLTSDSQQFQQLPNGMNINVVVARKQAQAVSTSDSQRQGPPADVMTHAHSNNNLHASLSNETLTNLSNNEAHPSLDFLNDDDVFDVLKSSNRADGQDFLGLDLGLGSNDYLTNYDVGAYFPAVGSVSRENLDFAMGKHGEYGYEKNGEADFFFLPDDEFAGFEGDDLDNPFGMLGEEKAVYEDVGWAGGFDGGQLPSSVTAKPPSTNFVVQREMRSELDDLKAFKAALDKKVGVKKKQETTPKKADLVASVDIPEPPAVPAESFVSPPLYFPEKVVTASSGQDDFSDDGNSEQATGANEYAEDFFDDRDEAAMQTPLSNNDGSASNNSKAQQRSDPPWKEELLGYDDDFASESSPDNTEHKATSGFGMSFENDRNVSNSSPGGGRKTLKGLGLTGVDDIVQLGVISGGVEVQRPNSRQGADGTQEKRPLPSAAFLNDIAELKASALKLNRSFGGK